MIDIFAQNWHNLVLSVTFLTLAVAISLVTHFVVFRLLRRFARREGVVVDASLVRHGEKPARWVFALVAALAVLPVLPLPPILMAALEHITGLGLIAAVAWVATLLIDVASNVLASRYRIDIADNVAARRVQTQFQMVRRVLVVVIAIIAASLMLMTFPAIRQIGESLLASAGLATLVVGMAMKGTLENLIASLQIAFAQPFRIGDAVVIEGEWGLIEEIGTMYVVIRIWDLRRLVLPLSYFLTHPFQNWTRNTSDILGSAILYADYTVPVEELRNELRRICESTSLWKGSVCVLQVSDATEHAVQLRALMDARNSGDAWDLRCLVREKLVGFLRTNRPESLPRYRGEFSGISGQTNAAPKLDFQGETAEISIQSNTRDNRKSA